MSRLPLFPVTTVGSWPRPQELLKSQRLLQLGRITREEFHRQAEASILELLEIQHEVGVDIVTDGEQRRDNFYSFVHDRIEGVRLMSMADMLDVVEDKAAFERILQTLDVPAFSLYNPSCVGHLERRRTLAVDECRFLKEHTDRPVKIPLPGPYLLTRAMWVPELSQQVYESKEELSRDVIRILREEIRELIAAGADFIQFDEPVLTEVVFTQGQTRTFMCAALSAKKDPAEELAFAVSLLNEVLQGFSGPTFGLHLCRGNWSPDESILLSGEYHPLKASLEAIRVDQLVLEYATERAGSVLPFEGKSLGLGVVNPRTPEVESVDRICDTVRGALKHFAPADLTLNPDCGFGTFSNSPVNSREIAAQKMNAIAEAARRLRKEYT